MNANFAKKYDRRNKKGQYVKSTVIERIAKFSGFAGRDPSECWPWTGALSKGYGLMKIGRRMVYAHRAAYEAFIGPIPGNKDLHHICRNRGCVNWRHLMPVTDFEHMLVDPVSPSAENFSKTSCKRGHELTPENTMERPWRGRIKRRCKTCHNVQATAANSRRRARIRGTPGLCPACLTPSAPGYKLCQRCITYKREYRRLKRAQP